MLNLKTLDGYVIKVLNNEETKFLKQIFIDLEYDDETMKMLKNFQMLYMPNIEITTENIQKIMENNQYIYYLTDFNNLGWYLQKKLSLRTLLYKNFTIIRTYINIQSKYNILTDFNHNEKHKNAYNKDYVNFCNHIYDTIKYRLQYTFMLINYIIIHDIARYLFLMYYEVTFG